MPIQPTDEEEIYFKKQELALRQQMRQQMATAAERSVQEGRRRELAERIQGLGFEGDKAKVFDLMPLVHVAWADGSISRKERATILDAVVARGIAPGTEPFQLVESMLEEPPPAAFMSETLELLKEVCGGKRADSIVDLCLAVADSSGGFLGLGSRVSGQERERIREIAAHFGSDALAKVQRSLL
ncbi:MAG TPA: hypothetical protein PKW35_17035 [Nannocystaceae bacterium]|nr:hypothetical protein [Nannocystaceae bacterium]